MSINLTKGQKIDLTKGNTGLDQLIVGLGWDPVQEKEKGFFASLRGSKGNNIDCDSSVIMLDEKGKLISNKDIVYFGNLKHSSDGVRHMGDNLTGDGEGDDEQIFIQLSKIPSNIHKLIFVVNIYDCISRKQDFGMFKNAFIRIVNHANHTEILKFNLSEGYKGYTALITGEVYRHAGEWKFAAIGEATTDSSLVQMTRKYK